MKKIIGLTVAFCFVLLACNRNGEEPVKKDQSNYQVASDRYSDLSDEALDRMANLEFDRWGEMMARDVEYYFPDGDYGTRTVLKGKTSVLHWWKNWKETTAIDSMRFTERVHVPIQANERLNYSGLTGVIVISYFSNKMVYNGQPVSVRTNVAVHFNDDSLIDRYYTYYDRTPILNTVNENALEIIVYKDSLDQRSEQ